MTDHYLRTLSFGVENTVFVIGFVFSAVVNSLFSGTSRFSRRDRCIEIENINFEPLPLMSMMMIHSIRKG